MTALYGLRGDRWASHLKASTRIRGKMGGKELFPRFAKQSSFYFQTDDMRVDAKNQVSTHLRAKCPVRNCEGVRFRWCSMIERFSVPGQENFRLKAKR